MFHMHFRTMYSAVLRKGAVYMSVKCIWYTVLIKFAVSLLILCLNDLSIVESGVLKFPHLLYCHFPFSLHLALSVLLFIFGSSDVGHINILSYWIFLVHCPVSKFCLTLRDPMDCNMPGFPILYHLPEFAQIHVHWVSDAVQPSHPLLPLFSPALNLSQNQGLF